MVAWMGFRASSLGPKPLCEVAASKRVDVAQQNVTNVASKCLAMGETKHGKEMFGSVRARWAMKV